MTSAMDGAFQRGDFDGTIEVYRRTKMWVWV